MLKQNINQNDIMINPPLLKKVIFMPIIEQPSLNTSSNPLYVDRKVNTSIETRTVYKIKPQLNITKLPPVFDLPRISGKFSKLEPLMNKPMMEKATRKPVLKPIELKRTNKNLIYNDDLHRNNKSNDKYAKTSEFYYNMMKKVQSDINKNEVNKLEKYLRDKEMSNISIMNNKNIIDQNLVIKKQSPLQSLKIDKYAHSKSEFISLDKNNKKFFHIPTLKIVLVEELKYEKFEKMQEYISQWKRLSHSAIEIMCMIDNGKNYELFLEKPQGGNIGYLVRSVGSISEDALRSIAKQVSHITEYFCSKITCDINTKKAFSIDSIWFDNKCNIKIFPIDLVNNENNNNNNLEKNLLFSKNKEVMFYFGKGLLDINLAVINKKVEDLINFNLTNEILSNNCCLYHYLFSQCPLFQQLINDKNYSPEYISFIHLITSFDSEFDIEKIQTHPWLVSTVYTNKSTLSELISLSKEYNFSNDYYLSNNNILNFDLLCEKINYSLPLCEDYFTYFDIINPSYVSQVDIIELSKEFRTDQENITSRLINSYINYFQNKTSN